MNAIAKMQLQSLSGLMHVWLGGWFGLGRAFFLASEVKKEEKTPMNALQCMQQLYITRI
jgi:hypothetical protein